MYANKEFVDRIQELSDADLTRLSERAQTGVHVATPVFDGAPEKEIFDLLQKRAYLNPDKPYCTTVGPASPLGEPSLLA